MCVIHGFLACFCIILFGIVDRKRDAVDNSQVTASISYSIDNFPYIVKIADFYIDDIYMADSPARVEVCSEAAWSDRRRCEIQPSESWTSNSITVRVNQSSFAPSEPVYLYVVDASGAVNSAGYALSFGSSAANGAAESGGGGGGGGGGCFINSIIP